MKCLAAAAACWIALPIATRAALILPDDNGIIPTSSIMMDPSPWQTQLTNEGTHDGEMSTNDGEMPTNDAEMSTSDAEMSTSDAEVTTSDAEVTTSDAEVTTSDAEVTTSDAEMPTNDVGVENIDSFVLKRHQEPPSGSSVVEDISTDGTASQQLNPEESTDSSASPQSNTEGSTDSNTSSQLTTEESTEQTTVENIEGSATSEPSANTTHDSVEKRGEESSVPPKESISPSITTTDSTSSSAVHDSSSKGESIDAGSPTESPSQPPIQLEGESSPSPILTSEQAPEESQPTEHVEQSDNHNSHGSGTDGNTAEEKKNTDDNAAEEKKNIDAAKKKEERQKEKQAEREKNKNKNKGGKNNDKNSNDNDNKNNNNADNGDSSRSAGSGSTTDSGATAGATAGATEAAAKAATGAKEASESSTSSKSDGSFIAHPGHSEDSHPKEAGLPAGAVVGIVMAVLSVVLAIVLVIAIRWNNNQRKLRALDIDLQLNKEFTSSPGYTGMVYPADVKLGLRNIMKNGRTSDGDGAAMGATKPQSMDHSDGSGGSRVDGGMGVTDSNMAYRLPETSAAMVVEGMPSELSAAAPQPIYGTMPWHPRPQFLYDDSLPAQQHRQIYDQTSHEHQYMYNAQFDYNHRQEYNQQYYGFYTPPPPVSTPYGLPTITPAEYAHNAVMAQMIPPSVTSLFAVHPPSNRGFPGVASPPPPVAPGQVVSTTYDSSAANAAYAYNSVDPSTTQPYPFATTAALAQSADFDLYPSLPHAMYREPARMSVIMADRPYVQAPMQPHTLSHLTSDDMVCTSTAADQDAYKHSSLIFPDETDLYPTLERTTNAMTVTRSGEVHDTSSSFVKSYEEGGFSYDMSFLDTYGLPSEPKNTRSFGFYQDEARLSRV
ncbi:hypothetical protein BASA61_002048 [Batrachochytrium salamandrivorans]|nr:hypothetical protein BASA61_002048 [Batrachochytrium salamandrivorans]